MNVSSPDHVLVVGAGLGGLRTVEGLRTIGYPGRISLVGEEPHAPYDRPPLSKQVLTGEWEPGRTTLRTVDELDDLGVRVHLGLRAVALAPGEVELSDGSSLHADAIVVATGLVARRLPDQPAGVLGLRTLDDAEVLRSQLRRAASLLVVGGGFIGAEVASAGRSYDLAVTVLEAQPVVASRALGPELGTLAGRLMSEAGVDVRGNVTLSGFAGDHTVVLADGTRYEADVVVVGIGGAPQVGWTGVAAPQGLPCGPTGRVEGLDGVWALGDVASWAGPDGVRRRHEHWTSAGDQAAVVARDIVGEPPPPPTVPYFWSDQFGLKIQLIGQAQDADAVVPLHGTGLAGGPVRGTVAGLLTGDRLVAVVGFGAARRVVRFRTLVASGADRAETTALAATLAAR